MYITNTDEVLPVLRSRLNDYLVKKGVKEPHDKKFLCILHSENTPSMYINPKTAGQTAHCFSCGGNLDIFKAASVLEDMPENGPEWMRTTIPYLANLLDIPLQFGEPSSMDMEKLRFYKLAQDIADIIESEEFINVDYVTERKWTNDYETCGTISEETLISKLVDKGWSAQELLHSMMVRTSSTSIFGEDKVTFTIRDPKGRPVGFISRNIGNQGPKYINSVNTVIFEKSKVLLGLDKALKTGKQQGIYVVEGPGDRAQALRLESLNVVSTMGTAFTAEHVNLLRMYGIRDVYFCLDWDTAGSLATSRIFQDVLREATGINCSVIEAPQDMGDRTDPDAYLFDSNEPQAINKLPRLTAFEWVMKNTSANDSPEAICTKMVPIIAAELTAVKREILINQLHKFTGISHQAIASDINSIRDRKYEERKNRLVAAANKYISDVEKDPNNLRSAMSQHESDISSIEKDYERDSIGVNYQLSRLNALQELKKPSDDGTDKTSFRMTAMPEFASCFEGGANWTVGTVIYMGGRPNSGKTATGTAVSVDVALSDPDTIVLMHYTDDPLNLTEPRILTNISKMINRNKKIKLTIGMTSNPWRQIKTQEHMVLYDQAFSTLRNLVAEEKLIMIDSTDGNTLTVLERYLGYVRRKYPDKKIFMFCDNTHNYTDFSWISDKTERMSQISNMQKNLTIKYQACMLATAEYRKNMPIDISQIKLPVNDDLADTRAMMFRSNAIIHVYNDLKDRGEDFAQFFWTDKARPGHKMPRLRLGFGKNKITAFSSYMFLDLDDEDVTLKYVTVEQAKRDFDAVAKAQDDDDDEEEKPKYPKRTFGVSASEWEQD